MDSVEWPAGGGRRGWGSGEGRGLDCACGKWDGIGFAVAIAEKGRGVSAKYGYRSLVPLSLARGPGARRECADVYVRAPRDEREDEEVDAWPSWGRATDVARGLDREVGLKT